MTKAPVTAEEIAKMLVVVADIAARIGETPHETIVSLYSDLYKENNGIRPRWSYGLPTEELARLYILEYNEMVERRECEERDIREHEEAFARAFRPAVVFTIAIVWPR